MSNEVFMIKMNTSNNKLKSFITKESIHVANTKLALKLNDKGAYLQIHRSPVQFLGMTALTLHLGWVIV